MKLLNTYLNWLSSKPELVAGVLDGLTQPVDELLALQEQVAAVRMDDAITEYILSLAEETRKRSDLVIGLSPRGTLALAEVSRASALLAGRDYVVPDDVKCLAAPACAHRLVTRGLAGDGAGGADAIFQQILQSTPAPK